MTDVVSSHIAAVDYELDEEVVTVEFKSGARWRYFGVPLEIYLEMLDAPSVGSYFYHRIRSIYRALPSKE